jgi:hypothetical protein
MGADIFTLRKILSNLGYQEKYPDIVYIVALHSKSKHSCEARVDESENVSNGDNASTTPDRARSLLAPQSRTPRRFRSGR